MADQYITKKPERDPAAGQYLYVMQDIQTTAGLKRATGWVRADNEVREDSPNIVTGEAAHNAIEQAKDELREEEMLEDRDTGDKYSMKFIVKNGHPAVEFTKEEG